MKPVIKESEYLYTLDEVAEALGLNKSTVGEAQRSALEKLRVELKKRGLNAENFLSNE